MAAEVPNSSSPILAQIASYAKKRAWEEEFARYYATRKIILARLRDVCACATCIPSAGSKSLRERAQDVLTSHPTLPVTTSSFDEMFSYVKEDVAQYIYEVERQIWQRIDADPSGAEALWYWELHLEAKEKLNHKRPDVLDGFLFGGIFGVAVSTIAFMVIMSH
jgi:hypothetical protein